jgi:hypothetical protein
MDRIGTPNDRQGVFEVVLDQCHGLRDAVSTRSTAGTISVRRRGRVGVTGGQPHVGAPCSAIPVGRSTDRAEN